MAKRQVTIYVDGKQVETSLKNINKEMNAVRRTMNEAKVGSDDYNKAVKRLKELDGVVQDHKKRLGGIETGWKSVTQGANKFLNASSIATAAGLAGITIGAEAAVSAIVDTVEQTKALRREISQATGAVGDELDIITIKSRAIARTFQQTESEVVQAANVLSKEFGISYEQALGQISEGFLQGANASGKFLENVREYATQFRAAGFAASEFINLNTKAAQEGIFSDKGLDTVKEFGLRIREQTKAVQDALDGAFGTAFTNKLFKGINDGSISTQKALQLVVKEINATEIPANRLQTVIADVFAAPGEDAGLRFIQTLADVGEGLDETAIRTNQYVEAQRELLEANENLATSENDLTKQLTETSDALTVFWTNLKAGAINVLVDVLQFFEEFGATLGGLRAAFGQVIDSLLGRETEFKSVGEAYRKSYLEGLKEIEVKRKTAEAFRLDEEAKQAIAKQEDERRKIIAKAAEKTRQEQQREAERQAKELEAAEKRLTDIVAKFANERTLALLDEEDRKLAELAQKYDEGIQLAKDLEAKGVKEATAQRLELEAQKEEALKEQREKFAQDELDRIIEQELAKQEAQIEADANFKEQQRKIYEDLKNLSIEQFEATTEEELIKTQDKFNQLLELAKAYGLDVSKIENEIFLKRQAAQEKLTLDLLQQENDLFAAQKDIQLAKLDFMSTVAGEIGAIAGDNAAIQQAVFIFQKAAAIAGVIIELQKQLAAIRTQWAVTRAQLAFTVAGQALIPGTYALQAGQTTTAKISAATSIAAIAGSTIANFVARKKQKKEGGWATVRGADDGQVYQARLIGQPMTGLLDHPHPVLTSSGILANEVGKEYYVSHSDLRNPRVLDHVRAIDNITSHRQRQNGGFASSSPAANTQAATPSGDPEMRQLLAMNAQLLGRLLSQGVQANFGNDEILALKRQVDRLDKASGGRA